MMLWGIFAALALATAAVLVTPLLRRWRDPLARSEFDLQIYREQLIELDRDQERGVLPADQAEAARTEIHRRILAAEEGQGPVSAPASRLRLPLALLVGIGIPLAAGLIYSRIGAPNLPGQPFASRQSDPAFKMTALTDDLAARLATAPDGEGFRRLGHAYVALQRYAEAATAFQHADRLGAGDSAMISAWGEALVMSQGGMVIPEARRLFLRAYAGDHDNPQARFYLGLAQAQIGSFDKAVAIWKDLELASGADAPWLPALRQHIEEAAKQGGFDPATITPAAPEAPAADEGVPSGDAAAAIAGMAPDQRDATIRSMVAGLAARLKNKPDDFDGWMRLSRSYAVLGDRDKGIDAARHAIKLQPKAVEPKLALAQLQLGDAPEDKLPADFLATLRDVLAIDPDNTAALYYIGAAEAAAGHTAEARKDWQKVVAKMPEGQPERADLQKRLDALK
jgi:cytochrome c-type biogenesis protein CcmH